MVLTLSSSKFFGCACSYIPRPYIIPLNLIFDDMNVSFLGILQLSKSTSVFPYYWTSYFKGWLLQRIQVFLSWPFSTTPSTLKKSPKLASLNSVPLVSLIPQTGLPSSSIFSPQSRPSPSTGTDSVQPSPSTSSLGPSPICTPSRPTPTSSLTFPVIIPSPQPQPTNTQPQPTLNLCKPETNLVSLCPMFTPWCS